MTRQTAHLILESLLQRYEMSLQLVFIINKGGAAFELNIAIKHAQHYIEGIHKLNIEQLDGNTVFCKVCKVNHNRETYHIQYQVYDMC